MGLLNKLLKHKNENQITDKAQINKFDAEKPVENPRLRALLYEYNNNRNNDIANKVFEEIAMNAKFLSVIVLSDEPVQNGNGTATFKKDSIMQFPMLVAQDEQSFIPVFTDWLELGKWEKMKSPKTLVLSFDDYMTMVFKDVITQGIVINPFSDNLVIDRQMMKHLKTRKDIIVKGVSEKTVTKDTQVLLGEPKNYPTEMIKAVSDYLKVNNSVNRAWIRLMLKEGEQSYLLVLDLSGDKAEIFSGIANAARPYLKDMYLDMVPYQDGFGKNAVENVVPFYEKR